MKRNAPALPKKKNYYFLAITLTLTGIIFGFSLAWLIKPNPVNKEDGGNVASQQPSPCPSSLILVRETDKPLIGPLIFADVATESQSYDALKDELTQTIDSYKEKGMISSASVYLRQLNDGSWMELNGSATYLPGSLMKVAIMLYYLKQEENKPGVLNEEFFCKKPVSEFPKQAYEGESIQAGRDYKVSELIHFMIVESDNLAANVLSQHLDAVQFHAMFDDLDIPADDINDLDYVINPKEYSKFLRALYNSSYVNPKLSEYGIKLLTQSGFRDGLGKKLPSGIIIARKFGERGRGRVSDFSESGIVYNGDKPYLITIMTRGTSMKEQAEVISEISEEVYRKFSRN